MTVRKSLIMCGLAGAAFISLPKGVIRDVSASTGLLMGVVAAKQIGSKVLMRRRPDAKTLVMQRSADGEWHARP